MTSRRPLSICLALALAACGSSSQNTPDARTPDAGPAAGKRYVLVHGAWLGAAGWTTVADRLRADGATVTTVELPAHGADTTPVADATFASYVARVDAAIDAAGGPVILVGHSMGGMVITQVAENRPSDLERLIYVAAFVPTDGQTLFALAMSDADSQIGPHLVFTADTVGIDQAFFVDLFCADCSASDKAALAAQYRDEPIAPLMTPITRTAAFDAVPRRYVHTSMDLAVSPAAQTAMVTATPMEREITLATSHVAMMAMPEAVADALLP